MMIRPTAIFTLAVLCSPVARAATDVSGAVDGDWDVAGSPYVCTTADLTVTAGHTLTIEPGVVVQFASSRRLQVAGTITAVGTADAPITFTTTSNSPAAGAWKQIQFQNTAKATLDYVMVQWAGQGTSAGTSMSAVQIGASTGSGSLLAGISHTSVLDCLGYGFRIATDNGTAHTVSLKSSTVQRAGKGGLDIMSASTLDSLTITGNDFTGNAGPPVQISAQALPAFNTSPNTFSGNLPGDIFSLPAYSSISHQVTLWHDVKVQPGSGGGPSVAPGNTLNVQPGVTMSLDVGQALDIRGALVAIGTSSQPVTFTAVNGTPGGWNGIWLHPGTAGTIDRARIEYADPSPSAAVLADGANLTITNTDIGFCTNNAVDFENSDLAPHTLAVGGCTIHDVSSGDSANPANAIRIGFTLPGDAVAITSNTFASVDRTISLAPSTLPALNSGPDAVAGNLPDDTIWIDGGSIPDGVTLWEKAATLSDLAVPLLSTFTMEPGSGLRMGGGSALNVSGNLVVSGKPGGVVVLDAVNGSPGSWGGVQFAPASTGTVTSAVVSNAGFAGSGNINVHGATVSVSGCAVLHGGGPGVLLTGMSVFSMKGTILRDNAGPAVQDTASGSRNIGGAAADGNDLLANGSPVDSATNDKQNAKYNYWGADSGPFHATLNPLGTGGSVSDHIDFIPFGISPLTLPIARLEPIVGPAQGVITVTGTASSALLDHWILEYGLGASPASFTTIVVGTDNAVNGTVANWDTAGLDPAQRYTVRLTVYDVLGRSARAMVVTNSPYGDISGDGIVNLPDAVLALRFALGRGTPTSTQLVTGDVRPLPKPDGKIKLDDAIAILKTAAGLSGKLP